ncbi:CHAT domain-containing protein [Sinosporangium siamense]|uniref:CHAT domain-containing protein n=1 Tax=Sinosporangium siamense TaxID=1367973 RepID=A0A919RLU3_9ACTN|nr:CHAT domain-containing protein [Sinosporangium siamense]GII96172.1 hypothetical protein Ssi02_64030 [Sinosporangium siamense]
MSDRSLRIVQQCVKRVLADREVSHVTKPGVLQHALTLDEALREGAYNTSPAIRLDAAHAAGMYGWFHQLAENPSDGSSLYMAIAHLTPCFMRGKGPLPDELLPDLADRAAHLLPGIVRSARDPGRAVAACRRLVAATPGGHEQLHHRLALLSAAFEVRFDHAGRPPDLDDAIEARRASLDLAPPGRAESSARLAALLAKRFTVSRDLNSLRAATVASDRALAECAPGDPALATALTGFAHHFGLWFDQTGDKSALDRAIAAGERALAATRPDEPAHLSAARTLGNLLTARHRALGDADALDRLIDMKESLLGHHDWAGILPGLLSALRKRHQRIGDLASLDRATALTEQALSRRVPARTYYLRVLCSLLRTRHHRTGVLDDLRRAAEVGETLAKESSADAPPLRSRALAEAAKARHEWHLRTGDPHALDRALTLAEQAVRHSPAGDPHRPRRLHDLARALQSRYRARGDLCDLDRAIVQAERALELTPRDHADRLAVAGDLGTMVHARFELAGRRADLEQAIALGEEATATPPDSPDPATRVRHLLSLGSALAARFTLTGARRDLARARRVVADAEALEGTAIRDRITIHLSQAGIAGLAGDAQAATAAFTVAAGLLPYLAPDGLPPGERVQIFGNVRRVAVDLAAAEAEAGRPGRAVELLDRARGGLIAKAAAEDPQAGTPVAEDGPVATVTATPRGGLALVHTGDPHRPVHTLPLPGLTELAARRKVELLRGALATLTDPANRERDRLYARQEVTVVLGWLWNEVVEPVLTILDRAGWDGARLWWCPLGIAASLPLHAAGRRDLGVYLSDRTVCSYTATLPALARARERAPATGPALVVAMSRTPGAAPLPDAGREAQAVAGELPGATVLHDEDATREAVLAALATHSVAHFACHAADSRKDPVGGTLLLHDHAAHPLTVAELSRLRPVEAELAYLSACRMRELLVPQADDALHLPWAFQLAGFRHVIATMWPIDGDAAADVAAEVYRDLTGGGQAPPDTARSGQALHHATRSLRERHPDRPELWAAHLHIGP